MLNVNINLLQNAINDKSLSPSNRMAMLRNSGSVLYEVIAGSVAYATSTPLSDEDNRGIFALPMSHYLSMNEAVNQISDDSETTEKKKNDDIFFTLKRFFELLKGSNPNVIELLWMPKDCIISSSPEIEKIIANRSLFISRGCLDSHLGYAISQSRRTRGKNKKVNNPCPKERPKKEDFCRVVSCMPGSPMWTHPDVPSSLKAPFRPIPLSEMPWVKLSDYHVAAVEHTRCTYRMYYYGKESAGIFRGDDMLACASIPMEDEFPRFCGILLYDESEYNRALSEWNSYHDWIKNRNSSRWIDQEKGLLDYDCYLAKETEFLTKDGWKKYKEITEGDLLATIDENHNLIYTKYTDRFCKKYSGKIYTYENRYTRFSVTPNHNLLLSECHRSAKTNFSTKYDGEKSDWKLIKVSDFMERRKSYYHIILSLLNNKSDSNISDDEIKLMGAFLSEGSICFDKQHKPRAIFISQLEGGRMCKVMKSIKSYEIAITEHYRKGRKELTYRIQDPVLASRFLEMMGHGCRNKKLPSQCIEFSARQMVLLLSSMVCGDGHDHPKGHTIYYSTSRKLINDLQLVLFSSGMATQPYFYGNKTHQLFISKSPKRYVAINKDINKRTKKNSFSGWLESNVKNVDVVCFSVPNSVLVTRNKNKIAVQGNSKNMMHCVRLLLSGINIIKNGEPIVRFEGKDQQHLMDIRNGKLKYEDIMCEVKDLVIEMEESAKTSSLTNKIDEEAIEELYSEVSQSAWCRLFGEEIVVS
jgi:uncharacterized protein